MGRFVRYPVTYKSNLTGIYGSEFTVGSVTIVVDGDRVLVRYPDLTEFVLTDRTPSSGGLTPSDPLYVLGRFNSPPIGVVSGDRVAVGQSPTGDFVGHAGDVATWNGLSWEFVESIDGWIGYSAGDSAPIIYVSSLGWITKELSPADVRQAVSDATDSNVFTDADKTKLDGIESGATGDMSASEVLALLLSVDGAGSGLDADLLDGQHGSHYLDLANSTGSLPSARFGDGSHGSRSGGSLHSLASGSAAGFMSAADKTKLDGIENGATGDQTPAEIRAGVDAATDSNVFTDADKTKLDGIESGATGDMSASEVLALLLSVDGAGSGLDAQYLGAQPYTAYALKSGAAFTGAVSMTSLSVDGVSSFGDVRSSSAVLDVNYGNAAATAGIRVGRSTDPKAAILWDEGSSTWTAGTIGSMHALLTSASTDIAAATLGGQPLGYVLDLANSTGSLPSARFGDGSHGSRSGGSLHSLASGSAAGFMSAADKTKLDGVAAGANNYSLPASVVHRDSGADITGAWEFQDDVRLSLGSGSEAGLTFAATPSRLELYAPALWIGGPDSGDINRQMVFADPNAGVSLSFAGAAKFSTTSTGASIVGNLAVSGLVDGRDVSALGDKLDTIESGATGDQTASEILALLLSVDGSGSGLDADTVDGIHASALAPIFSPALTGTPTAPTQLQSDDSTKISTTAYVRTAIAAATAPGSVSNSMLASSPAASVKGRALGSGSGSPIDLTAAQLRAIVNVEDGATGDQTASEILALLLSVDGSGSGLDADTVDGIHASALALLGGSTFENSLNTGTFSGQNQVRLSNAHYGSRASLTFRTEAIDGTFDRAAITGTADAASGTGKIETYSRLGDGTWTKTLSVSHTGDVALFGRLFATDGTDSQPSLAFGSGGGFWRGSGIGVSVSGGNRFYFTASGLDADDASGPRITSGATSAAVPSIVPNRASPNTGIGAQSAGAISGIVSGLERTRTTSSAFGSLGRVSVGSLAPTDFSSAQDDLVVGDGIASSGAVFRAPADGSSTLSFLDADSASAGGSLSYAHSADELRVRVGAANRLVVSTTAVSTTVPLMLASDPSSSLQAATKQYVDSVASSSPGSSLVKSVRLSSPVPVNLSSPGSTHDGVTAVVGDRLLLTEQSNAAHNGIYDYAGPASPLTRSSDSASFTPGTTVFVSEGSTRANRYYTLTTDSPIDVGTTDLVFERVVASTIGETFTGRLLLPDGSQSAPAVSFAADQDTGIYRSGSALKASIGSAEIVSVDSSGLEVTGTLSATSKRFVIPHPSVPGRRLVHASLEGPENGVYLRGRSGGWSICRIDFPEYWVGLVDSATVTCSLTPRGRWQPLSAELFDDHMLVKTSSWINRKMDFDFVLFGTRSDIPVLEVEA